MRKRFEQSVEKILCTAEPLAGICPTEYMEIWGLFIYSAVNHGDEQRLF